LSTGPVGLTRGAVQTGVLRFTEEIFVYKWLLLAIGEIISNYYLFVAIG